MEFNKKRLLLKAASLFAFVLVSCVSTSRSEPFVMKESVNRGSIAVISATSNDVDVELSRLLEIELKKSGFFTVLPESAVRAKLKVYPTELIDTKKDYNADEWSKDTGEMDRQNRKILRNIQSKLRTEYLLVVWIGGTQVSSGGCMILGSQCSMNVIARLFKKGKNNIIGYSDFFISKSSPVLSRNKIFLSMLPEAAKRMVKNIVKNKGV